MISIDVTSLPELLEQLRAARVSVFRLDGLEIVFNAIEPAPMPVRSPTPVAPVTDPERAPIHPLDALLDAPAFTVPRPE